MSTKRSTLENYAAWPDNPTYIEFKRTDGDSGRWPSTTTRIVDNEGQVNFFLHLNSDHAQNRRWRHVVGGAVAKALSLPAGPKYVLKDFPEGYRFYDHHKGPAPAPRHDVYLYGAPAKRFRSIQEFIPHATWLLKDNPGSCDCKYCTKRTQKEITAELGAAGVIKPSQSGSPGPPRIKLSRPKGKARDPLKRERPKRETRVYASVQRISRPNLASPSPNVLSTPMLAERHNDLRAIYSKTSMELARWFREGEVVWCWLEYPIVHPDDPSISIQFWPGVVEETKLKSVPVPRQAGPDTLNNDNVPSSTHIPRNASALFKEGIGPTLDPSDDPLPWSIQQSTDYKIQLLAVSHMCTVPDDCVIPYAAYVPSNEMIEFMQNLPPERLVFDKEALLKVNPCPGPIPPSIFDAIPAYAAALEIGSVLSTYWCLTDDYEVKFSISASPPSTPKSLRPPLPTRIPTQPSPLSQLQNASEDTENDPPIQATQHSYHRNPQPIAPDLTPTQAQQTTKHLLGSPPPVGDFTQTRYQGLWWGSERIWTDDFVRLKVPRRTLAPHGTAEILAPSGPGQAVIDGWKALGKDDISELGAGSRGIFLRLDGIFAVDVPSQRGPKKDARVCGQLFELADEDWEETDKYLLDAIAAGNIRGTVKSTPDPVGGPSNAGKSATNGGSMPPTGGGAKPPNYPLPMPPKGYRFRPILAPGQEFVGALSILSGRYYPRILSHPKLKPKVDEVLERPDEEGGVVVFDNLWALEGLSGGYYNSMDPQRYRKNRTAMLQEAEKEAIDSLKDFVERQRLESEMAVDQPYIDPADIDMEDMYA